MEEICSPPYLEVNPFNNVATIAFDTAIGSKNT